MSLQGRNFASYQAEVYWTWIENARNGDKMIILQNYKLFVKWLGLEPFRLNNVKNNFNAFCYLVVGISFIMMSVANIILNINDLEKTTNSIITIAGVILTSTFSLHFLLNSDRITFLEKYLQDIVNESKWNASHTKFKVNWFERCSNRKKSDLCRMWETIFRLHVNYHTGWLLDRRRDSVSICTCCIWFVHGKVHRGIVELFPHFVVIIGPRAW